MMLLTMGICCAASGSERSVRPMDHVYIPLSKRSPYYQWWEEFRRYCRDKSSRDSLVAMRFILKCNPEILSCKHHSVKRYPLEVLAIIAHESGDPKSAEYRLFSEIVCLDNNKSRRDVVKWSINGNNSLIAYLVLQSGAYIRADPTIMVAAVRACDRLHKEKRCRKVRDERYALWAIIDMLLASRADLSGVMPMMESLSQARCNGEECVGCHKILEACQSSLLRTQLPTPSAPSMLGAGSVRTICTVLPQPFKYMDGASNERS